MQINSIYGYNTNFNSLYASKRTLQLIGCTRQDLLNNRSIYNASKMYDVVVRAGNNDIYKYDPWWPMNMLLRTFSTTMAAGAAGAIAATYCIDVATAGFWDVLPWAAIPILGAIGLNRLYDKYKDRPVKEIIIQAGKGVDINEDYIKNCSTPEHVMQNADADLPLIKEVKEAENTAFKEKIRTYNTNDLFSAKKYLEALKQADIEILGGGDFFNRKIDKQGNTMLTQFFEVVPTEENKQEYEEILNILKNVKGINYNQIGGDEIPCIEKIIFSENKLVLPLISGQEFDYSPNVEVLYNNIQDEGFKNLFDSAKLKFNFVDILQAVKLNSWDNLTQLRSQLNSPLCNRSYLANQIKEILESKYSRPQNRGDYAAREYVYTNFNEYVNPDKVVRLNE